MREERRQAKKRVDLQTLFPGNEEVQLINLAALILQVTLQSQGFPRGDCRTQRISVPVIRKEASVVLKILEMP